MIGGKSIKVYNKIRKKKRKSIRPELCERMSAKKGTRDLVSFGLNILKIWEMSRKNNFIPSG